MQNFDCLDLAATDSNILLHVADHGNMIYLWIYMALCICFSFSRITLIISFSFTCMFVSHVCNDHLIWFVLIQKARN